MQAVDGPNSSQLEWHQIGVKTKNNPTLVVTGAESGGRPLPSYSAHNMPLSALSLHPADFANLSRQSAENGFRKTLRTTFPAVSLRCAVDKFCQSAIATVNIGSLVFGQTAKWAATVSA